VTHLTVSLTLELALSARLAGALVWYARGDGAHASA